MAELAYQGLMFRTEPRGSVANHAEKSALARQIFGGTADTEFIFEEAHWISNLLKVYVKTGEGDV